ESLRFKSGISSINLMGEEAAVRASIPAVMLMPTVRSLGFFELNQLRAYNIWFLGLSTQTHQVDDLEMRPIQFLRHDYAHALLPVFFHAPGYSEVGIEDYLRREIQ